jgi:hypothetical protein
LVGVPFGDVSDVLLQTNDVRLRAKESENGRRHGGEGSARRLGCWKVAGTHSKTSSRRESCRPEDEASEEKRESQASGVSSRPSAIFAVAGRRASPTHINLLRLCSQLFEILLRGSVLLEQLDLPLDLLDSPDVVRHLSATRQRARGQRSPSFSQTEEGGHAFAVDVSSSLTDSRSKSVALRYSSRRW